MPWYSRRAEKDISALPATVQQRVRTMGDRLDREPAAGPKLLGRLAGKRSARVGRNVRMIYELRDGQVFVLTVMPRKDAYR